MNAPYSALKTLAKISNPENIRNMREGQLNDYKRLFNEAKADYLKTDIAKRDGEFPEAGLVFKVWEDVFNIPNEKRLFRK